MNRRTERTSQTGAIYAGKNEIAAMLGVGLATAARVGRESGARRTIGSRVIYNVAMIQDYIEQQAEAAAVQ